MSQHGIARSTRVLTPEQKLAEQQKIAKYRSLEDQVRTLVSRADYASPELFQLTSTLLRLNPEYYTIWNVRRRCLTSSSSSRPSGGSSPSRASPSSSPAGTRTTRSASSSSSSSTATPPSRGPPTAGSTGTTAETTLLRSELTFTIPLLLESPKCYWIWNYRLWILQQAITRLPVAAARRIWEDELGLASKMLTKDRRNFHAWGYRRQVVEQLESPALHGASMVEPEFAYTDKMIRADLSNFSAWHRRSTLIPRLLDERKADDVARRAFLDKELALIREALNVGPEDQSLWYYHQYLVLNLVTTAGRPTIAPALTLEDRVIYLTRELVDIKDLLEDYDDVKLIYEALMEYTMYLCQLEERKPGTDEKTHLVEWLRKLKKLDPMRNGRWEDVERDYGLAEPHFSIT
ncbi:geranylgeranyl transferase type-2 subunit alpha [Podospora conica]|nr:geranylgeranyl transferase type-2 subunit alpha [Schizothecium conicum]